jgi:hypothetical protein
MKKFALGFMSAISILSLALNGLLIYAIYNLLDPKVFLRELLDSLF